jgi:hypothetical protein
VTIWKIFRWSGKVAVFAAMAALLLQASCTVGLAPMATAETASSTHSGCHDSAPATPGVPSSGQKCCNGEHSAEALLAAPPTEPMPLVSAQFISSTVFGSSALSRRTNGIVTPPSGPPGLLVLRI